jgi:hypothetical protein
MSRSRARRLPMDRSVMFYTPARRSFTHRTPGEGSGGEPEAPGTRKSPLARPDLGSNGRRITRPSGTRWPSRSATSRERYEGEMHTVDEEYQRHNRLSAKGIADEMIEMYKVYDVPPTSATRSSLSSRSATAWRLPSTPRGSRRSPPAETAGSVGDG